MVNLNIRLNSERLTFLRGRRIAGISAGFSSLEQPVTKSAPY